MSLGHDLSQSLCLAYAFPRVAGGGMTLPETAGFEGMGKDLPELWGDSIIASFPAVRDEMPIHVCSDVVTEPLS